MYNEGSLVYYESCSLETIGIALTRYVHLCHLKTKDVGQRSQFDHTAGVAYYTSGEQKDMEKT
jgi:hypothetical protein